MTKAKEVSEVITLAFRVKSQGSNLFSAEILLIKGDTIVDRREGVGTLLGHAIAASEDLMAGFALNSIETKPEEYFANVMVI